MNWWEYKFGNSIANWFWKNIVSNSKGQFFGGAYLVPILSSKETMLCVISSHQIMLCANPKNINAFILLSLSHLNSSQSLQALYSKKNLNFIQYKKEVDYVHWIHTEKKQSFVCWTRAQATGKHGFVMPSRSSPWSVQSSRQKEKFDSKEHQVNLKITRNLNFMFKHKTWNE